MRNTGLCNTGGPLRVLYFAPRECWPTNTGAKLRNFHLARELARRASVTYLSFSDVSNRIDSRDGLEARSPLFADERGRTITVPYERGYTVSKIIRGLLGPTPLPVLNYTTPAMTRALERVLDEQSFDIVQVEGIHLFSYLPIIRAARSRPLVVCDWHNVESELMQRYSEHARSRARRFYARATARSLSRLECRAMSQFDAHIAVSERDRARLLEVAPDASVFVAENGVESDYFSDGEIERAHAKWLAEIKQIELKDFDIKQAAEPHQRKRLVYVGSMDYHANIDAARQFAREVWPGVLEQNPDLVFTIVGRNPSAEVRALAELPGIEVTGTVEDVRPYYREAFAAVVPLRIGGGSRLKILEAMAAGVPVVSTRLGAEGLDVRDGENIILADTTRELSQSIADLARNEMFCFKLSEAARSFVRDRYDWSAIGASLLDTHLSLARRPNSLINAEDSVQRIDCSYGHCS